MCTFPNVLVSTYHSSWTAVVQNDIPTDTLLYIIYVLSVVYLVYRRSGQQVTLNRHSGQSPTCDTDHSDITGSGACEILRALVFQIRHRGDLIQVPFFHLQNEAIAWNLTGLFFLFEKSPQVRSRQNQWEHGSAAPSVIRYTLWHHSARLCKCTRLDGAGQLISRQGGVGIISRCIALPKYLKLKFCKQFSK